VFKHHGVLPNNEHVDCNDDGHDNDNDNSSSDSEDEDDNNCNDNHEGEDVEERDGKAYKVAIDPTDILYVLEMLLLLHAWYKCGGPSDVGMMQVGSTFIKQFQKCFKQLRTRYHKISAMVGSYRNFMICCMFQETCICLGIHKTGMPVQENIISLILQSDQLEEHKSIIVPLCCK